jgi:hypothetical protein
MLKPYNPKLMEACAVSRAENNVKNDTELCLEPGLVALMGYPEREAPSR